jgi:hypothetical protein
MPVWIAKIKALASQLPPAFLFDRDSIFRQPVFPPRQFLGTNREREMKLAIAVVRRLDCA